LTAAAGLEVHLPNCYKVQQMRKARGWVKTNKKNASRSGTGQLLHPMVHA
jgi:hypothetical protein